MPCSSWKCSCFFFFYYKTKACSKTNQLENSFINIFCSLIYWWVSLYILVVASLLFNVYIGFVQHLLNWMSLKITFIKTFETSFSQVRSWILLRSEWLARVTGRDTGTALSRIYSCFWARRHKGHYTFSWSEYPMHNIWWVGFFLFLICYWNLSPLVIKELIEKIVSSCLSVLASFVTDFDDLWKWNYFLNLKNVFTYRDLLSSQLLIRSDIFQIICNLIYSILCKSKSTSLNILDIEKGTVWGTRVLDLFCEKDLVR